MIDLCFIYPLPGCVKILLLVIPCSDVRSSVAWWRPVAVVSRSTTPMPRSVRGDEGAEGIDGARSWRIWDILQWGLLNDTKCQVWEFLNITRKKTSVRDDNCTVDYYIYIYPPSNFSYEMGRTWATVQMASQDFFVQTGGVVPPFLYLESFCSWFLSNHHFHFVVVYVELVEASNIKSHWHFVVVQVE